VLNHLVKALAIGLSFHKQVGCLSIFPQQFTYYLLFLIPPSLSLSLPMRVTVVYPGSHPGGI